MSNFKQKILPSSNLNRISSYPTQNEYVVTNRRSISTGNLSQYNLNPLKRTRHLNATLFLGNRKLPYSSFSALPRFMSPRFRLRNVLFKSQPFRKLFHALPTIYEEDTDNRSSNSQSSENQPKPLIDSKKKLKKKRFKPSSYYSSFANDKTEIEYDQYLYSDSYSESKPAKNSTLVSYPSMDNQRVTVTSPVHRLSSTDKQKLEMKEILDIEFERFKEKKRGTSRSSSFDNFLRPSDLEKRTASTVEMNPTTNVHLLKLRTDRILDPPFKSKDHLSMPSINAEKERDKYQRASMPQLSSSYKTSDFQYNYNDPQDNQHMNLTKPQKSNYQKMNSIGNMAASNTISRLQNNMNNGMKYSRSGNASYDMNLAQLQRAQQKRLLNNESPKIRIINRTGEMPPKPLKLNTNNTTNIRKTPPINSQVYEKNLLLNQTRPLSSVSEKNIKNSPSQTSLILRDENKQLPVKYTTTTPVYQTQKNLRNPLMTQDVKTSEKKLLKTASTKNMLTVKPPVSHTSSNTQRIINEKSKGDTSMNKDQFRYLQNAPKSKKTDSILSPKFSQNLPNFYNTYFLNEPKNEYKIEDYLYKPSVDLNSSAATKVDYQSSQTNSIPFTYKKNEQTFGSETNLNTKSKSSVEYSDFNKKKVVRKKNLVDDENRLLSIIKDLKLTLEAYLDNDNNNNTIDKENGGFKKQENSLISFLVTPKSKSPIDQMKLEKSDSSSMNSTLEETVESFEIIY